MLLIACLATLGGEYRTIRAESPELETLAQPEPVELDAAAESTIEPPEVLSYPRSIAEVIAEEVSPCCDDCLPPIVEGSCNPFPPAYGPSNECMGPPCPYCPTQSGAQSICGVDCGGCNAPCNKTWKDAQRIPWSMFGPGEYVGPARTEHVSRYYLRVNDEIDVVYMRSRKRTPEAYRISVGDLLTVDSLNDTYPDRQLQVQPDGKISLPLIGQVEAAGNTVAELKEEIRQRLTNFVRDPQIDIYMNTTDAALAALIDAVDRRAGNGGQSQNTIVTPEGTIQLPGLGSIYVQGLSLEELQREVELRYEAKYGVGLSVTPLLARRAPSFVFIGGEVRNPGRFTLEGPTTVMQAIALAGGWNVGGNVNQIVVFRRDENWCLKATKLDLQKPLFGNDPCPVNDVWLRDNDLVIVPKRPILVADDIIELYFTRGVYSVFPVTFFYDLRGGSVITE